MEEEISSSILKIVNKNPLTINQIKKKLNTNSHKVWDVIKYLRLSNKIKRIKFIPNNKEELMGNNRSKYKYYV